MESGLFESEGRLFDVCACAIFDGQEMHIGYSCAWELPQAVQEKVLKEGMDLTQVRLSLCCSLAKSATARLVGLTPFIFAPRPSTRARCATIQTSGIRAG